MIKKFLNNRYYLAAIIIILLGGLVWLGVFYYQAQNKIKSLSDPQKRLEMEKEEVQGILKKVGKHIMLPEGEMPTVASINDAKKLAAEQPFYSGAQNGDKVLVFVKNRIAIVYSSERDIIVNMGPVILNNNSTSTDPVLNSDSNSNSEKSLVPTSSSSIKDIEINSPIIKEVGKIIKIDVRNGSNINNAAKIFADSLPKDKYQVLNIANASKKNYQGNVVVNLNSVNIEDLNTRLKAEITEKLPSGEAASQADVLVVIGNTVK